MRNWIVAIRLQGHARYAIHGTFPSYIDASIWLQNRLSAMPVPPVATRVLPLLSPDEASEHMAEAEFEGETISADGSVE